MKNYYQKISLGLLAVLLIVLFQNLTVSPQFPVAYSSIKLLSGQSININNYLLSYQKDGNLVFYNDKKVALWSSNSPMDCASHCVMHFYINGNLFLQKDSKTYWTTNTYGETGAQIVFSNTTPFIRIVNKGFLRWKSSANPLEINGNVDVVDYMVMNQFGAIPTNSHLIYGHQSKFATDPEKLSSKTFVTHKFSRKDAYEVYTYDSEKIQIRFEVNQNGQGNIRRTDGLVWSKRVVNPSAPSGFETKYSLDDIVNYNGIYKIRSATSLAGIKMYNTAFRAYLKWGENNLTGLNLNTVLRIRQEWNLEGRIFEEYDYAKYVGLVNWRWNESVEYILSRPAANLPGVFKCEEKYITLDTSVSPPKAYRYNINTHQTETALDVFYAKSYWTNKGQYYVSCRQLMKEYPLKLVSGVYYPVNYALPGSTTQTIANLPYMYTHNPHLSSSAIPTDKTEWIKRIYTVGLGRLPDQGGLDYWLSVAHSQTTIAQCQTIQRDFFSGAEFNNRITTFTNEELIRFGYWLILLRGPNEIDQPGFNYWLNLLNNGTISRMQFINYLNNEIFLCYKIGFR